MINREMADMETKANGAGAYRSRSSISLFTGAFKGNAEIPVHHFEPPNKR